MRLQMISTIKVKKNIVSTLGAPVRQILLKLAATLSGPNHAMRMRHDKHSFRVFRVRPEPYKP